MPIAAPINVDRLWINVDRFLINVDRLSINIDRLLINVDRLSIKMDQLLIHVDRLSIKTGSIPDPPGENGHPQMTQMDTDLDTIASAKHLRRLGG